MKAPFGFVVTYQNKTYSLQVVKQHWGDGHRYALSIEGLGLFFDSTSDGKYKPALIPGQKIPSGTIPEGLLDLVAEELGKIDSEKN